MPGILVLMPFKPPLHLDQLRAISARRRQDADVLALLWEIRRLHAVVLQAEQLLNMAPPKPGGSTVDILLANWQLRMSEEPIVLKQAEARAELLAKKL